MKGCQLANDGYKGFGNTGVGDHWGWENWGLATLGLGNTGVRKDWHLETVALKRLRFENRGGWKHRGFVENGFSKNWGVNTGI